MKRHVKILIVITLLIVITIALIGCGNVNNETTNDTSNESTSETISETISETTSEMTNVTTQDNTALKKEQGIVFNGKSIAISDIVDDEKIEGILGVADEIKTHTYTKDDGKNMDQLNGMTEKQYHYSGLVLKTINGATDDTYYVFSIELTDPKVQTIGTIKVGDSFDKLKAVYPEGQLLSGDLTNEANEYRYEPDSYAEYMTFHLKGKVIERISINKLLD